MLAATTSPHRQTERAEELGAGADAEVTTNRTKKASCDNELVTKNDERDHGLANNSGAEQLITDDDEAKLDEEHDVEW